MRILLDKGEIDKATFGKEGYDDNIVKATGKKILIQLQAIYNLPDGGMFNEKMGEFLQKLEEEVK